MEKNYLVHLHNVDADASGLLGSFDADDSYIIEPKIIEELKVCNKVILEYKDDIITAEATVSEYKLKFYVYLQNGENNQKRAGLFLAEKGKLGFIEKELQTYVHSIVQENTGAFMQAVKTEFHLFTVDDSEGQDMSNLNLKEIIGKKGTKPKKYKTMIPVLANLDKEYVGKMLTLLKNSGPYGQNILKQIKEQVSNKKLVKTSPTYWRDLKNLIDITLLKNPGLLEANILQKMSDLQSQYINIFANAKEPVVEKPASKGGAKKSAPKKKDDKKKKKKKPAKKKEGDKGGASKGQKPKDDKQSESSGGFTVEYTSVKTVEVKQDGTIEVDEIFGYKVVNNVKNIKTKKDDKEKDKDKEKEKAFGIFKKREKEDQGLER